MGQRLNIEIKENGKVLANAYYHWSGYTSSSVNLIQIILDNVEKIYCEDRTINAIKLLEVTGAGLTDQEVEYAKKHIKDFNFAECTGRNDGLIAISKRGIKETRRWEEARVEMDLISKTINFDAIWKRTIEEYKEDYEQYGDEKYDYIPVYDISFDDIQFDKFSEFKELILGLINSERYQIKLKDDEKVYMFIE